MPFQSKAQLRTCYGRQKLSRGEKPSSRGEKPSKGGWNCDQWVKETPDICSLPSFSNPKGSKEQVKSRMRRPNEKIIGPVQTGPRGGKFFVITQKTLKGKEMCHIKIYI